MSLTQEQVKHIANLSRLSLTEEDIPKYQKDLNSIVDYIDILAKADDTELSQIVHDESKCLPPREDIVRKAYIASREELLACSPKNIVNHQIAINNIMH
jgi:aspartyl-tRNA(Asn)/glutamyl-tRNA(Gln) amidotransferase subunit C